MRKSKLIVLMLTVAMLLPMFGMSSYAADLTEISDTSPAIGVTVGEAVDLSMYSIDGVSCDKISWMGTKEGTTLDGSKFEATEKGVYSFTGEYNDDEYSLYFVVKETDEDEYVLYENTFDSSDALDDLSTIAGTSATIEDGQLKVTGQSTRVLLPEFLGDFGDYKIEAKVTMTEAVEPTRWFSVMYRIQNNNYPYYQMAVRQNATANNGVEFAEMASSGYWSVHETSSFTEALSQTKQYTFIIEAFENTVAESIDGSQLILTQGATKYDKGGIGFQISNSTILVDSIKVTLLDSAPTKPEKYYETVDVRDFTSNLATTPTVVSYINTSDEYNNVLTDSPATAIFTLNDNAEIVDKGGNKIASLEEMYEKIENKVIAAFKVDTETAVDNLTSFLKSKMIEDVLIVSDKGDIVNYARETYTKCRGAIIFEDSGEYDEDTLMAIREEVNSNKSKIAILPYSMAKKELVSFLQERLISVWVETPENETEPQALAAILSGANGIIVTNRKQAENCFTEYFEPNSFTREIYIIGHRGVPSLAPENTIEGSAYAAELGAQIIENDIYLTKDGVIVVMHDGTIDRTTNGTGEVESFTLEELQQYVVDTHPDEYPDAKIPTLEDYFKEFKDTDTLLFIEIKSSKPALVTELARLVDEYDFYDQMCIISFNASQIQALQEEMPGMSMGYLCYGLLGETDPIGNVEKAMNLTQLYNTTFNHSYAGVSEEFITELNHRGITAWPWTYNEDQRDLFNTHYLFGTFGLTTNYSQWVSNTVKQVVSDSYDYQLEPGESKEIALKTVTYDHTETDLGDDADIVMLWGEDVVDVDGNYFTAKTEGEAAFFVRYKTQFMKNDNGYSEDIYIYSPVIRLSVEEPEVSVDISLDESSELGIKEGVEWYIYVIVIVAVATIAAIVVIAIKKNKK